MPSRELIKVLIQDGWYAVKTNGGSHQKYRHPTKQEHVIVPHPKKDLPAPTVRNILRRAGL